MNVSGKEINFPVLQMQAVPYWLYVSKYWEFQVTKGK